MYALGNLKTVETNGDLFPSYLSFFRRIFTAYIRLKEWEGKTEL
ncbi:unknow [Vibrio campbellii]|nr:unknow [Vibrio campbellii]